MSSRARRSESELVEELRRGNTGVVAEVYDRVLPGIMFTLKRLLRDQESDHEDLAQLVIMELVTSIERFRGDCSLEHWASRIAANLALKHLRKRAPERRAVQDGDGVLELAVAANTRTEREAIYRSAIDRVRHHLDQMDPDRATTFLLHDAWGFDLKEIAEITATSVAAAQSRLVRGRRELHERIAADTELAQSLDRSGGEE